SFFTTEKSSHDAPRASRSRSGDSRCDLRHIDGAVCCEQETARRSLTNALRGLWTPPPVVPLRLRLRLMTRNKLHDALTRGRRLNVLLPVVAALIGVGLLLNYTFGSSSKSTLAPAFSAAELAAPPTDNWL